MPTLIIHGDDDQIVPIGDSAALSAKLVKDATLKVYPGAPHGLANTHKDSSTLTCWPSCAASQQCVARAAPRPGQRPVRGHELEHLRGRQGRRWAAKRASDLMIAATAASNALPIDSG